MTEAGFRLLGSYELPQYQATAFLYKHEKHGCPLLHLKTKDTNNTFAITVKSVCDNDSGSTHVLEHMTLHGSEKYPINEIFNELEKRSYANYLNAETRFDSTQYPFSTQNEQDFHNVLDIYLDAVLNPRFIENNFLIECHHIEQTDLNDKNSPLKHCGVVYNEMSGIYDSPEDYYLERLRAALLPDTPYKYIFGGEPSNIAKLTIDELKAAHDKYYSHSNMLFFHYGSFDINKIFEHINSFLDKKPICPIEFDIDQLRQPFFDKPRREECHGPMNAIGDEEKQVCSTIAWHVGDISDIDLYMDLYIISSMLCASCSSPLYQKLIKSQVATSFIDYGPDITTKNLTFSIGIEGLEENGVGEFERIVFEEIKNASENGFSELQIEGALHNIEIGNRKMPGNIGKMLLSTITTRWVLGQDPFILLDDDKQLKDLRNRICQKGYLEGVIKKYLLENPSRITFTMRPEKGFIENRASRIKKELEDFQGTLSSEQLESIRLKGIELKEHVEKPKPLHLLPCITIKDLALDFKHADIEKHGPITIIKSATNGIIHVTLRCEVDVNNPVIEDIYMFTSVFTCIGCGGLDDKAFSEQEDLYTSGYNCYTNIVHLVQGKDEPKVFIEISFGMLERNVTKAMDLLRKICLDPFLDNREQIVAILNMTASDLSDMLHECGSNIAASRSAAALRRKLAIHELVKGVSFFTRLDRMVEEDDFDEAVDGIFDVYHELFRRGRFDACVHCEAGLVDSILSPLQNLITELNQTADVKALDNPQRYAYIDEYMSTLAKDVFVEIDSTTNDTAVSMTSCFYMDELSPALTILNEHLTSTKFYREVREKLGAYGAYCTSFSKEGYFNFVSFRDTSPESVVKAARSVLEDVAAGGVTKEETEQAIVRIFAQLDSPCAPSREFASYHSQGMSDEIYGERRRKLLAVTPEDLAKAARLLLQSEWRTAIVGGSNPPEGFDVVCFSK